MANNLTGDFDVVAEFSVLAVDRVLAAMHQTGRFLHSISLRVDDNPHPGHGPIGPTVFGSVDTFGDAIANQLRIGSPGRSPGALAGTDAIYSRLGVLVNPDLLGAVIAPPEPSHIQGVAQLQLSPPTVVSPTAPGANLTVRMNVIARFFPDKDTAPLAQFIRGDLQISAPINKVAAGRVHVLDIDFKAEDANINFTPSFPTNLSAEDLAGINLCVQNGLRTGFLPSSVMLPSSITNVQLRTLPGALAVLLDFNAHPSSVSSVNNVFLTGNDGFAFAAGREYVLNTLRLVSSNILTQQFPPVKFTVDLKVWGVGKTLHYSYPISLSSAAFDLQPGKIVLTIHGTAGPEQHGHPPSGPFSFTVTVEFFLQPSGNTVQLGLKHVSVDTSSTLAGIVDFFTGDLTNSVRDAVTAAFAATDANTSVDRMFNTDTNLANFLNAQLSPSDGTPAAQPQQISLMYTSVDIQPAGVVLHGLLYLRPWSDPHVEFEQIPTNTGGHPSPVAIPGQGPDYSALKTWIPGGTIAEYDWSRQGQTTPFEVDTNKFVLLDSGPSSVSTAAAATHEAQAIPAYSSLCLTVKGSRISNFGPTIDAVSARVCGFNRFNVGGLVGLATGGVALPMLAVTRSGPSGEVVVSGHSPAQIDQGGSNAPNLIVHFADSKSAGQLDGLTRAVKLSKRTDAPTAIIAVVTPDQLSKLRYSADVVYSDDHDAWQNALGLKSSGRPLTVIVSPRGGLAWQHEGPLELEKFAAELNKHLVKRGPVRLSMPRLNLRIGQPAPNFLFEYAPGREMPLRKFAGQPLTLVFWKSTVKASIQALRDYQNKEVKNGDQAPILLAINDGDPAELARGAAAEAGITAIVVADPKRDISLAYGVSLLPTIISVGPSGNVSGIQYGYVPGEHNDSDPRKPGGHRD